MNCDSYNKYEYKCTEEAVFYLYSKYGFGKNDYDTFYLCEKCKKEVKKEQERYGYHHIIEKIRKG